MKKTIFLGLAVLMAMAFISCDASPGGGGMLEEPDFYIDQTTGQYLKGITINVDKTSSKALTQGMAQSSITFYEVAFKDPNTPATIHRTTWPHTKTGRIYLPTGDNYGTAGNSILFAGKGADKTLFALGSWTATTDSAGTGTAGTVTMTTTSITFTLVALTNNVKENNDSSILSSFVITGSNPTTYPVPTTTFVQNGRAVTVPYFKVPSSGTGLTATYSILGPSNNHWNGVWYNTATAPAKLVSVGITTSENDLPPVKLISGTVAASPATTNGVSLTSGVFTLTMSTPASNGFCMISIEVPVFALSEANNAVKWVIVGGPHNELLDTGAANNSTGGSVVLGIGNLSPIDIITIAP